jgi:hypothetical protein
MRIWEMEPNGVTFPNIFLNQLCSPALVLTTSQNARVIVSWLSFWLDRSAIAPRIALGITTLLTINTQVI